VSTGDGARDERRPVPVTPWGVDRRWTLAFAGMVVVFVLLGGYDLISGGVLRGPVSSSSMASSSSSAMLIGPTVTLTVVDATAFGPNGTSDGDNRGMASRVLHGGGAWDSSWYATAEFGRMQSGTGILLDMGHAVTVNSVALELGSAAGADVQVRVGDSAALDSMSTAANMSNAHGTVHLPLNSPTTARYVLIWFIRLPVKSPGKYQVSLYRATVDGHA
jgi:hypothetical protein